RHVERCQEVAAPGPVDDDAVFPEAGERPPRHNGELHRRRRAEAVDEQRDPCIPPELAVSEDGAEDRLDNLVRAPDGAALDALFAMDAEPELDLVLPEREARCAGGWHRAGAEPDPHRAEGTGSLTRKACHFGQRLARLCRRARHLVHEYGAGDAAATVLRNEIAQRHV